MKVSIFLKLIALAEAGFDLYALAKEAQAKEAAGESQDQISLWLDELYEEAFREMNATD